MQHIAGESYGSMCVCVCVCVWQIYVTNAHQVFYLCLQRCFVRHSIRRMSAVGAPLSLCTSGAFTQCWQPSDPPQPSNTLHENSLSVSDGHCGAKGCCDIVKVALLLTLKGGGIKLQATQSELDVRGSVSFVLS